MRPWDRVERWVCVAVSRPQFSSADQQVPSPILLPPSWTLPQSHCSLWKYEPSWPAFNDKKSARPAGRRGRPLSPSFAVTTEIIKRLLRRRLPSDRVIFEAGT